MQILKIKNIKFDNVSSYILVNNVQHINLNNDINLNLNNENNNILFYLKNVELDSNPNIVFDELIVKMNFNNITNSIELNYEDFEGIKLVTDLKNDDILNSSINQDMPLMIFGKNNNLLNNKLLIIDSASEISEDINRKVITETNISQSTTKTYSLLLNDVLIKAKNSFRYLQEKVKIENISDFFKYFYSVFFDSNYDFDINGFSLIFMYPPHLSGLPDAESPDFLFKDYFQDFMIFAVEFDVNEHVLKTSNIGISSGSEIQYVSGFNTSQDISIRFIDDKKLKMYGFHEKWINYMKDIIYGNLEPNEDYIDSKELDYAASFYYLKFKSNMDVPNYIGKATGVFPKTLPVKELFGNRTDNQIIMYNINYFCVSYEGYVLDFQNSSDDSGNYLLKQKNWLYDEFTNLISNSYRG